MIEYLTALMVSIAFLTRCRAASLTRTAIRTGGFYEVNPIQDWVSQRPYALWPFNVALAVVYVLGVYDVYSIYPAAGVIVSAILLVAFSADWLRDEIMLRRV